MKKVKVIVVVAVSVLALIVFLQNTESVETKLLFAKVTMSRALLLILTFLIGFVVGLVTMAHIMHKPRVSGKQA